MQLKLFVAERFRPERSDIRLLDPEQRQATQERHVLYKTLPKDFGIHSFERVPSIRECDYVIVPQAVRDITPEWQRYFRQVRTHAQEAGKETLVFIGRDDAHRRHIDEGIVFKASEYTHSQRPNEVVFAPFVEDLGEAHGVHFREKGGKPVVSFCGYAGFPSWKTRVKYVLKNAALDTLAHATRHSDFLVYKRGIFFRKKALAMLAGDPRIETQFIVRESYSGNLGTVEKGIDTRAEYIENMRQADFVLAPKGDANFSSRFFEALSMGRVPILIDTNMPMPFPHELNYDEFTIRVPHTELHRIADIVMERWNALSHADFRRMQERAREVFLSHLRFDAYWNRALPLLKDHGVRALR